MAFGDVEAGVGADLLKLLENGSENDVTIVCQDGELKANRDILMARSEYFARMIGNENFEEGRNNQVEMRDVPKSEMYLVLKYLFSGTVDRQIFYTPKVFRIMNLFRQMLLQRPLDMSLDIMMGFLDNISQHPQDHGRRDEPTLCRCYGSRGGRDRCIRGIEKGC